MKTNAWLLTKMFVWAFVLETLFVPLGAGAGGKVAAWGDNTYGQCRLPNGLNNVKAVAAGQYHNLALRIDGTVAAWGLNDYGQTNLPFALSRVVAVSSGAYHNLALKVDGTVVAWGRNLEGQTNVPAGLSNVIAVAAGGGHNLALRADGTLVAWGDNYFGLTNVPAGLADVVEIAAGGAHNLALMANGSVVAWGGANNYGVINVPAGLSNVLAVAAGGGHSLALKMDGTVAAWGYGEQGQINVPSGLSNVVKIAAGTYQSLALKADGTVVAWGLDDRPVANLPTGMANVTALAGGYTHALALVFNGPIQITQPPQSQSVTYTSNATFSVVATGMETLSYQWLFNGSPISPNARVSGTTNSTLNISNAQFSDIGTYRVVVSNAFGSVASYEAVLTVISPPFITGAPADRTVRAGTDVTLGATADGTPPLRYQWNFNGTDISGATNTTLTLLNAQPAASGYYYLRVTNSYGSAQTIRALLTVTNAAPYFTRVASNQITVLGGSAAFVVAARGSTPLAYQWRFNGGDLLGETNATLQLNQLRYDQSGYYNVEVSNAFGATNSPKVLLNVSQVALAGLPFSGTTNMPLALSNVIAVAAGGSHVMALRSDGTVRTWLANVGYQFGSPNVVTNIPGSATNLVAIAAGYDHCVALRSNGTVVAWGGYYGSGVTNVPLGLSNVVGIAAGWSRSYAVRADGTVTGWGTSATVPTGLSNVVAVAAGQSQNLALRRDGTVVVWPGYSAPFSVVPGLSNAIAVATSSSGSRALRQDGTVVTWPANSVVTPTPVFQGNVVVSNAVALALGSGVSLILKQDGALVSSSFEKTPFPVTNNISAIAAGGVQSGFGVAVLGDGTPAFTIQPISQSVQKSNTVQLHARAAGLQPLRYQWLRDNAPVPGATNASLTLSNVLGRDLGDYRLIASNALGLAVSRMATISIPFNSNLAAALNLTNYQWTSSDQRLPAWFAQNRETHDGDVAAQSGATTNGGQSTLQVFLPTAGTLTFWWKVSSEEDFDFLRVYVDQNLVPVASLSGETAWEQRTITFTNGQHSVRWVYSKDGSVSAGRDAGFLDEVVFTPPPPTARIQPGSLTVMPGNNASFFAVTESVVKPVTYQWMRFGTNLPGATNQTLSFPLVGRKDRGSYSVRVGNAGGSVVTSNAVLHVIVPQRLSGARRLADGSMEVVSRDFNGGAMAAPDLPLFEAQASTNLIHWQTLPGVLSVTNGSLLLRDPEAARWPQRFYRVVEH